MAATSEATRDRAVALDLFLGNVLVVHLTAICRGAITRNCTLRRSPFYAVRYDTRRRSVRTAIRQAKLGTSDS